MSRPRFLRLSTAIVALVAIAATLAACGGGDESGGSPQQIVDAATLEGIDSANLELSLDVKATGKDGGDLDLGISGPFQSEGEGELPQLAVAVKVDGNASGSEIKFDGGLVLLPDKAYVNYEGVDYEVDPTTLAFVESTIMQQQREAGSEGGSDEAAACQEAVGKLEVGEFIDNAASEGGADVGGTSTTKVSGDLNVSGAIDALVEVARSPACSGQLAAAGPLPSEKEIDEAKSEVQGAVKTARVDVYVGDDDIVRRISAQLKIKPEDGGDGPSSVKIEFDLKLTGVNEDQEISAPDGAKPLNDLFLKLDVDPIELLGLLQGEGGGNLGELFEGLGDGSGDGGLGGLGELFESLSGTAGGGSGGGGSDGGGSGGGGTAGGGSGGGGDRQAYLECLQGSRSPADLQRCAELVR